MRRALLASTIVLSAAAVAGVAAQAVNWPAENPPRPLASRPVSLSAVRAAHAAQRDAGDRRDAHEQPEVTDAPHRARGGGYDPPGKSGTASLRRRC
jgi:hypothetical protein